MQNKYEILELFPTPIYTTSLPQKFSELIPWFYKQEILKEGVDSANYGERSENSYILDETPCSDLKSFILDQAQEFGQSLGYDYSSYKLSQSWLSYKTPGQHHSAHTHPNSLISGVFYFGNSNENTPAIKFHKYIGSTNTSHILPKTIIDKRNYPYAHTEFSVNFSPGLLLLFPSYLVHSVPVNQTKSVRCSLAFNIVPTEGFGDEKTLTELKF